MHIDPLHYAVSRFVTQHPQWFIRLGLMESGLLPALPSVVIDRPVYICGLARSGSTLLLELMASHADFTSFRYEDFPFVFTPYGWNTLLKIIPRRLLERERAHGDGMMITPQSPEAMEEVLWRAFFKGQDAMNLLSADLQHPAFEQFYMDSVRKLLLVRGAKRYVSKGNYNSVRMPYLRRMFPDARFIIPIRHPLTHVASLMHQHQRFCQASDRNSRIAFYMAMAGHFEFGPLREAVLIDPTAYSRLCEAWNAGREAEGWAHYWDMLYRYLYTLCHSDALGKSAIIVRYEDLCGYPVKEISRILSHCEVVPNADWLEKSALKVRRDLESHSLTQAEQEKVLEITRTTAGLYAYKA